MSGRNSQAPVSRPDRPAAWLPAVGPAGENLVGPPTDPRLAAWWRGPCVAQAVDAFAPAARNVGRPLRLPVAEAGRGARGGAAVSGKLEAGALKARARAPRSHAAHTSLDLRAARLARLLQLLTRADVTCTGPTLPLRGASRSARGCW